MKKISLFLACATVILGLSSCSEDRDPVYKAPTSFVLNTPVFQNQYLNLTEGETFELVASQPDYGYSAITQYSAEVSLTETFDDFRTLTPTGSGTLARMTFNDSDLATALCELHGFDSEETYQDIPAERVYFRAVAQLKGVEGSMIKSNVVYYDKVKLYFAVAVPGYIYLVGTPEGWAGPTESNAAHYADWRLFEDPNAIGSKIYSGVFDIPAAPVFRFYTALTGWDADSWGSQTDDNPIEFEIVDGSFSTGLVSGKGSFSFPAWAGGKMTIVVDMSVENNYTLTILAGEQSVVTPRYIYLVGTPEGWAGPTEENADHYNSWRLVDNSESGVYVGTFDMPAAPVFRFYTALGSWDENSIGSQADDNALEFTLTNGEYAGAYVAGKGSWSFPEYEGGSMTLTVDTNTSTVSFSAN